MKSYIITTESTQKTDQEVLMIIIKALAKAGIKTTQAGIQKIKPVNLTKRTLSDKKRNLI